MLLGREAGAEKPSSGGGDEESALDHDFSSPALAHQPLDCGSALAPAGDSRRPASAAHDRFQDRIRATAAASRQAEQRQDDQEVGEVVSVATCEAMTYQPSGGLAPSQPSRIASADEDPEELLVERPVGGRADAGGVEPGQEGQDAIDAEHGDDAAELVGDGAQDRVERQEVPFRHDMRRRHRAGWPGRSCPHGRDSSGCRRRTRRRRS